MRVALSNLLLIKSNKVIIKPREREREEWVGKGESKKVRDVVIRQKKSFKIRIKEKVINIILIIKEERTRKKQEVCRKEVERNAWPAAAGSTDSLRRRRTGWTSSSSSFRCECEEITTATATRARNTTYLIIFKQITICGTERSKKGAFLTKTKNKTTLEHTQ